MAGCAIDPINHAKSIRDLYEKAGDTHKKYYSPVLWDKKEETVVNNESSEIILMLTQAFDKYATGLLASLDLYPLALMKRTHGYIQELTMVWIR